MGRRDADGEASGVLDAAPGDVWRLICDGTRLVTWWPRAERAEDVEGGRFTLVLRSKRDVPVRMDWRVAASRREEVQRFEQEMVGTPFARVLLKSAVEIRLSPADGERCAVTVRVERQLQQASWPSRVLGRRAARRQAGESLDRLRRAAEA